MPTQVRSTGYGRAALDTLRDVVNEAKSSDPMAAVTILVPNNIAGIVARRHLAHGTNIDRRQLAHGTNGTPAGVAGIYVLTLPRLAEQLASPQLAPRRPATRAIVGAAWRQALTADAGVFADVATHPATVRALTSAHRGLRDLSDDALQAIEPVTAITPDLVRLHRSVTAQLGDEWHDPVNLLHAAADLIRSNPGTTAELGALVLYLPQDLTQAEVSFAAALAAHADTTVIVGLTNVRRADGAIHTTLDRLGLGRLGPDRPGLTAAEPAHQTRPTATNVLHASDADDEVRCVVRDVVASLDTTPAHRVAVLYAAPSPYARLLHEHLTAAGITVNGAGIRAVNERAVARVLTETLALVDGDLPRADLFRALSNAPTSDFTGARIPVARWERTSRSAGVVAGDDWQQRLTRLIDTEQAAIDELKSGDDPWQGMIERSQRSIDAATALRAFAVELRRQLSEAGQLTTWRELSGWCRTLFHVLVSEGPALLKLPAEEQYAAAAVEQTLNAITTLDTLGAPADLQGLRDLLDAELSTSLPRVGRFGDGVLVAPISASIGLDVDVVYVVGLAEDLYPGRLHEDALLPERVRDAAGGELPSYRERLHTRYRQLLAAFAAGRQRSVASFPRGDLRRSSHRLPSRWLLHTLRELSGDTMLPATEWQTADYRGAMIGSGSFGSTLLTTGQLAHEQEWRVRSASAGHDLRDATVDKAVELIRARAGDDFTRFDGNLRDVDGLPAYATDDRAVSPTALESYATCPHAFFVQRLLGVSQLEQPESLVVISPAEIGNLIHASLDQLVREFAGDLPSYGAPWTQAQRARLIEIAQQKGREFEAQGLTGHPRLWEREKVRILSDLAWLLDADDAWRAEKSARVAASEMAFGFKRQRPVEIVVPGGRVLMRGSADKVDIDKDGTIYVTDVKTGSDSKFADISADDPVVGGTKLQLPVYAHAAREWFGDRATPVEAAYWFVRPDRVREARTRRDGYRISVPLTPAVEAMYADTLGTIVASIASGLFPAHAPEAPDWSWVQCDYCNPDGIGHGDVRSRWERKRHDPVLAGYVGLVEPDVLACGGDD